MKSKTPWPTKAVMAQVYENHLWGGKDKDFYSGEGSHEDDLVKPYLDAIVSFLTSFENPLTVCDLGCGDFNIGKELVRYSKNYIAVDIVDKLIQRNKEKFKIDNLEFHCLDIAIDHLPKGDCAIIRQVLQHLSNEEVRKTINKLSIYQYIIITEHIPIGKFIPNEEIISGQGIRLKKKSGLDLLAPPFNWKVKEAKILTSIELKENKGKLVTTLFVV